MNEWPWALLTPRSERWRLRGVAINGGTSVGGLSPLSRTDGGGLWVGEQNILLHSRAQIKVARAIEGLLDGGSGQCVAWSYEEPFAPAGLVAGRVTHSNGATFSNGALYLVAPTGAVVTEDAALRATSLRIGLVVGSLEGGERFSIVHPTKGRRRYTVTRVEGDTATIRPPLREAVVVGEGMDFLRVGCVSRLANPEDFLGSFGVDRMIEATAIWVESFDVA